MQINKKPLKERRSVRSWCAPWAPSETHIDETNIKQGKQLIETVLSYFVSINDLFDVTHSEFLEDYGFTAEQDGNTLTCGKRYLYYINENLEKWTYDHIILFWLYLYNKGT